MPSDAHLYNSINRWEKYPQLLSVDWWTVRDAHTKAELQTGRVNLITERGLPESINDVIPQSDKAKWGANKKWGRRSAAWKSPWRHQNIAFEEIFIVFKPWRCLPHFDVTLNGWIGTNKLAKDVDVVILINLKYQLRGSANAISRDDTPVQSWRCIILTTYFRGPETLQVTLFVLLE